MNRLSCLILLLLAAGGCSTDPCHGRGPNCISATIDGSPRQLDQLQILTDAAPTTGMTPRVPSSFTLPVDVAIVLPAATSGVAHVRVDGYLAQQLAATSATLEIPLPSKHVDFILSPTTAGELPPDDLAFTGTPEDLAGSDGSAGGADLSCGSGCPPVVTVSLSAMTQSMKLNDAQQLTVTVTPIAGFNGTVQLTATGMPAGVMATFATPSLIVPGAPAMTTLSLSTASNTVTFSNQPITIKAAAAGASPATTNLALTVTPELLVFIALGVDTGTATMPNQSAFGPYGMPVLFVAPGTKITFVNNDAIDHEIHADGTLGIAHEPGPLTKNGGTYTQTFTGTGPFNFYCHIHNYMQGQINVQ